MEGLQSSGHPAVFSGLLYKLAPRLGGRLWLSEMLANVFNSSFWRSTQAPLRLYVLALYHVMKLRCMGNAGFADVSD